MIETCATHSATARHSLVLSEPAAEVERAADEQRLLVVAAQQVDARLVRSALGFEAVPSLEAGEVALGEDEVILLHFVDQLAAGFAEPQRGPTILSRLEAGAEPLGRAIEVRGLLGIAEDLVERRSVELVVREPPGNFGGEVVAVEFVVGDVDL